jgi:shikimate kinase
MPAAGKTTTAKWLAQKLGWSYLDLDAQIESKMGMRIAEIFSVLGEEKFREIEASTLRETASMSNLVVGCGGGTAAFHHNMDWMKSQGLTVFLNTSFDVLVQRIAETESERPLFMGCDKREILQKLTEIAEKRNIYYGSAKIIWNKSEPTDFLYKAVNQLVSA